MPMKSIHTLLALLMLVFTATAGDWVTYAGKAGPGYASASQTVSIPASSIARADASISSSGSIVSCITPMRNGTAINALLTQ